MRWARSWVLCAAYYYPALWLAVGCVWALPGVLRSAFSGEHIVDLRVTAFGLMVWTAPADPTIHPNSAHAFLASASSFWILIPMAIAIGAGLSRARLIRRMLSGLVVSLLADVALLLPFMRLRGSDQFSISVVLSSIFFFALLCFGLYWMSAGWATSGYWSRAASLWASAALPPCLFWFVLRPQHGFQFRDFLWMLALPPVAGALLASFRKPKLSAADLKPVEVRVILSGLAITVLLAIGMAWGGPSMVQAFQEHRQEANQAAVAKLPPISVNAPYPRLFFQKGISFSAEFPDPYASEGARQMLRSLRADGVNAVSLIPYGWMSLGSPDVHGFGRHSWESEEGLHELSRLAHAIGMKVMLKPGIWIRGGHFGGDIKFATQAKREKWFDEFGKFIDRYAKVATEIHADLFCVGGEFVRMSQYTSEWRKIITNVRQIYPGPLTYAANFGDEFQNLKFWDALDYIGLQEYYPLPSDLSTGTLVARVEAVQKRFHKPVIFAEVGFPSAPGANRHPWEDGKSGEVDLQLQARCYRAIFHAFYAKSWFEGMYWWKVGTNSFGGPNDTSLTPWGKPAMEVIKKWYEGGETQNARSSKPAKE